ncbi:hypothetical protein KQX54_000034, partial [Cotesia glomerata]
SKNELLRDNHRIRNSKITNPSSLESSPDDNDEEETRVAKAKADRKNKKQSESRCQKRKVEEIIKVYENVKQNKKQAISEELDSVNDIGTDQVNGTGSDDFDHIERQSDVETDEEEINKRNTTVNKRLTRIRIPKVILSQRRERRSGYSK